MSLFWLSCFLPVNQNICSSLAKRPNISPCEWGAGNELGYKQSTLLLVHHISLLEKQLLVLVQFRKNCEAVLLYNLTSGKLILLPFGSLCDDGSLIYELGGGCCLLRGCFSSPVLLGLKNPRENLPLPSCWIWSRTCVCVLQTSELLLKWKMRNSSHFLRWVLDLVGTSQVLRNWLTSKQAKKKRRMLKKHEHQTEDR